MLLGLPTRRLMETSFSLGPHYDELLNRLVATGRYGSAAEAIRDGLRLLDEREQLRAAKLDRLRRDIEDGLASGPAEALDMEILKREAREARSLAARPRSGEA
jgi:antitoxin ParD1/3/4